MNNTDILFQILDWDSSHIEDDEGNKKFIARLFGKTKEDKSIYVEVEQFTPYFYVEIDSKWR
jgi:DNA polymerase elongation subunit (family B)